MARIIHFEIPSAEPEKTIQFFSDVFGWSFQRWGEEDYWLAATGPENEAGINGAVIRRRAADMPVVNTILVEDIDAIIAAIQQNGGEIVVPKISIPGMGYQCYFKDPDGVIHGVIMYDSTAAS